MAEIACGEQGPCSSVWLAPAVWAPKSSAAFQLVNGSRFALSGTKSGFCELLPVPTFLLFFVKYVASAGLGPKAGH